jgi:hypothetical protein
MQKIAEIRASKNPAFTMLYFSAYRNEAGVVVIPQAKVVRTIDVTDLQIVVGDVVEV